ncbi:MAG: HEAT repeat domain-containing protein [Pirellulaceae bacterium]
MGWLELTGIGVGIELASSSFGVAVNFSQGFDRTHMASGSEHWIHAVLQWLASGDAEAGEQLPAIQAAIGQAEWLELESCLGVVENQLEAMEIRPERSRILIQTVSARLKALKDSAEGSEYATIEAELFERLYGRFVELEHSMAAAHCLQALAFQADDESLEALARQLGESPPGSWEETGLALSPLWSATEEQVGSFFDALSDGFLQPTTLNVLLDLANYRVRSELSAAHPWAVRAEQLSELLKNVVGRLGYFERDPTQFGDNVEEVQKTLQESVSLSVSLCDALGLIGDKCAVPVLENALDLSHRRIQTEAAGALARMDEDLGKARLMELAQDSVARARAVAYAEELGFVEEMPEDVRHSEALAESELAAWLAGPEQFGFPPQSIELVDSRTQHWPSFEEPQNCYLFRYEYQLPNGPVSNVGIAGPLCQGFQADLANLPVDDIYAAYAGWQAEHEEIFEVPVEQLNASQRVEADRLEQSLRALDYEIEQSIALAMFFGELSLVVNVRKAGAAFCAVTDGNELTCYSKTEHPASMNAEVVLCIYRGRKLLRTFNT